MSGGAVRVEQRGSARWLILNRPERRNAIDDDLIAALDREARAAEDDPGTSVVVIAGEGKSFCAGADFHHFLSEHDKGGVLAFLSRVSECLSRIERSPKPWIAAIHGHAIAGGLEIALVCDVVVAAEGTLIGDGHVNNALLPGAGSSVRLERAVGKGWARWLHLSGDLVRAQELSSTGWIREVVAIDALHATAQGIAERLASRNAHVQQGFKRLLVDQNELGPDLQRELEAFGSNWLANDTPAALRAFLAERASTSGTVAS